MNEVIDAHAIPSAGTPRFIVIATWLAPVLILCGFAFVAAAPIALAVVGHLRSRSTRLIRVLAVGWAVVYFVSFALYLSQDTYPSMTKMYSAWAHIGMALPGIGIGLLLLRNRA
jgi:hypothetical protein